MFCKHDGSEKLYCAGNHFRVQAHILSSVEILDADGASDAQLALELLRDCGMFPHVKCKHRSNDSGVRVPRG